MKNQKMRIKLKAYDSTIIDQASSRIVNIAKEFKCEISGPIPLPTNKEIITVIRSPHKHKDSREQFEVRTHKRLIDIYNPSSKLVDAFAKLDLPTGVNVVVDLGGKR
ncbi:MAG: 30S ribosomal protein S10 [Clostridia bacterium]|nr:30S ribosomal protein S10 [Clostridia bacterium]